MAVRASRSLLGQVSGFGQKSCFSCSFLRFFEDFREIKDLKRSQNHKNQGISSFGTSKGAKTLYLPLFLVLLGMTIAWSSSGPGDDGFQLIFYNLLLDFLWIFYTFSIHFAWSKKAAFLDQARVSHL